MNPVPQNNASFESLIDPSQGNFVKGISVEADQFLGVLTFAALQKIIHNPADIQPQSVKRHPEYAEEIDLHSQVQRLLAGAKKKNLASFGMYIEQKVKGERDGVLPTVTAVCLEPLQTIVMPGGMEFLVIPFDTTLVLADGETQIAAWYDQYLKSEQKSEYRKSLAAAKIKINIHHNKSVRTARQYFHDLNALGVVVSVNQAAAMDSEDPINQIVASLETHIPQLANRVERHSRQVAKSSDKIVTVLALRQFVIDMAKGLSGVQQGSRPLQPGEVSYDALERASLAWLRALFANYEAQIVNRGDFVMSSPAVLAVLGALGQPVYEAAQTGGDVQHAVGKQLDRLALVKWNRGAQWDGVAGKMSPNGLALGGPKEFAYTIFNAITDPESPFYSKVRS
jgi:hypothetical protein